MTFYELMSENAEYKNRGELLENVQLPIKKQPELCVSETLN